MTLTSEEIDRYARHIVLRDIGGPGRAKLKAARVLAIGAGGLGSPLTQYLAAAGVGTIGIVDDDIVSLSNLQRQVIHSTPDIGRLKTESAADRLKALNPFVTVEQHPFRVTPDNVRDLVRNYDLVADGSDNFTTRYAVSDACFYEKKPLITAAASGASLTTIRAWETGLDGKPNPTYRCLFPNHRRRSHSDLRRSGRAGCIGRNHGLPDGARSHPHHCRFRRRACRKIADGGCPFHAFRDVALRLGPEQPPERDCKILKCRLQS